MRADDLDRDGYTVERLGPVKPNGKASRRRRLGTMTAAELMDKNLPPIRYIVPSLIAEGLTLLGGKAKLGKSWLLLSTCIAVATGGVALGSIKVEQGDVLYLALEDNERRLQSRLNRLLPNGARPERLFIELSCPRLDDRLLEDLRAWIERVPDPRLIVVDVLNRVRPAQRPNEGWYEYDVRCLEGLQALAAEFGIAIVLVHHTRKDEAEDPFDCLSGSTGLTGTADTTLILTRDSGGFTLYGRGRDIEEIEKALSFDHATGHWTLLGEVGDVRRSDERSLIVSALREAANELSPADIATATGMKPGNVRFLLYKMGSAGEVIRSGRGRYTLPLSPPTNNANDANNAYRAARDGGADVV